MIRTTIHEKTLELKNVIKVIDEFEKSQFISSNVTSFDVVFRRRDRFIKKS